MNSQLLGQNEGKRKRWKALLLAVLILVLSWLFTGGVVVQNYMTYGGQERVKTGSGPDIVLRIDTNVNERGCPFLLTTVTSSLPYSLCLTIVDTDNMVSSLTITSLLIEYGSGEKVEIIPIDGEWIGMFEEYSFSNSTSKGVIHTKSKRLQSCFSAVIDKPQDFQLTIIAEYQYSHGQAQKVFVKKTFEKYSEFYLQTGWQRIAGH